ncbi:MAG TPA: coenzyme F420-0:L-glutamate ligase [Actinomycetota bacterium]|nr:coenzyme F420-0:L-glutamate ligase [Actinomycetota bacterium]
MNDAPPSEIKILPITGIPEVQEGDDLAQIIVDANPTHGFENNDVLVVAQKVVSKAEGRTVQAEDRRRFAEEESRRILRRAGDMIISETMHGFVCANAGVDASNVEPGTITLLPQDPDLSARRMRARIKHLTGIDVAVIVSDTFGRAWRLGQTNVAIGVAGMNPFSDYVGTTDGYGNELSATRICSADELAGAAELVMRKTTGVCAAVVRGAVVDREAGSARAIARPPGEDLFR